MDIGDILIRILFGGVIGFVIGMTSIGAGALVLPCLIVFLGFAPTLAVGTASVYAFTTKIYATFRHLRLGTVDARFARIFLAGAIPATLIVAWRINQHIAVLQQRPERLAEFQSALNVIIAMVVLISAAVLALMLLRRRPSSGEPPASLPWSERLHGRRRLFVPLVGAVIGATIGATGVGGGVLIVPVLILIFRIPAEKTVGTSIVIAFTVSLLTAIVYGKSGEVEWATAFIMAGAAWVGVHWGSHLTIRIPDRQLKFFIVLAIAVAATLMFFK